MDRRSYKWDVPDPGGGVGEDGQVGGELAPEPANGRNNNCECERLSGIDKRFCRSRELAFQRNV